MIQGNTEAETLHLNGWKVGDILEGDEGFGPDRILITGIGEEQFTCRWMYKGRDVFEKESGNTTLSCRDWRKVDEVQTGKPEAPAWDGEGEMPPVGSRCLKGYERVIILAHTNVGSPYDPAIVYQSLDDPGDIDWAVCNVFSPIRSEEDKAVEEIASILSQLPMSAVNKSDLAGHLYCAIRDGKIPGVTLAGGEG